MQYLMALILSLLCSVLSEFELSVNCNKKVEDKASRALADN